MSYIFILCTNNLLCFVDHFDRLLMIANTKELEKERGGGERRDRLILSLSYSFNLRAEYLKI